MKSGPTDRDAYLDIAADLRPLLEKIDGFLSIERFEVADRKGKILSLSFWRDEEAVKAWRTQPDHGLAQKAGRRWRVPGLSPARGAGACAITA